MEVFETESLVSLDCLGTKIKAWHEGDEAHKDDPLLDVLEDTIATLENGYDASGKDIIDFVMEDWSEHMLDFHERNAAEEESTFKKGRNSLGVELIDDEELQQKKSALRGDVSLHTVLESDSWGYKLKAGDFIPCEAPDCCHPSCDWRTEYDEDTTYAYKGTPLTYPRS